MTDGRFSSDNAKQREAVNEIKDDDLQKVSSADILQRMKDRQRCKYLRKNLMQMETSQMKANLYPLYIILLEIVVEMKNRWQMNYYTTFESVRVIVPQLIQS